MANVIYNPSKKEPKWSRGKYKLGNVWLKPGRNFLSDDIVKDLAASNEYKKLVKSGALSILDGEELETLKKKKVESFIETEKGEIKISSLTVKEAIALIEMEPSKDQIVKWSLEEKKGKNRGSIIDYLKTRLETLK